MFKLTKKPQGRKIFYGITPQGIEVSGEWIKLHHQKIYIKDRRFWRQVSKLSDKPHAAGEE